MRGDFDEDEMDDYCTTCDDEGVILVCVDDICRAIGECIHGDGYAPCPRCCRRAAQEGQP